MEEAKRTLQRLLDQGKTAEAIEIIRRIQEEGWEVTGFFQQNTPSLDFSAAKTHLTPQTTQPFIPLPVATNRLPGYVRSIPRNHLPDLGARYTEEDPPNWSSPSGDMDG